VLSFVNLLGVILTVIGLGGLAPWSRWQFIGLFAILETASGLANVISPNIWRLPVAELQTTRRTRTALAASALLLPHWGGLARCAAGVVLLALVAWQEGLGPGSLALLPLVLLLACSVLAISAALARGGVARPDLDVLQLVVRWRDRERELPAISLGASVFQFLLGVVTIPAVKLLPPSVLYQPELAPSGESLVLLLVSSVALVVLVYVLWSGRIRIEALPDQQREAERNA
jgi:hypothetical protein